MATVTATRAPRQQPARTTCTVLSPGGNLTCHNPRCNGRGHVWIHPSSAPDSKAESEYDY